MSGHDDKLAQRLVEAMQRLVALHFNLSITSLVEKLLGERSMFRSMNDLENYTIRATDGSIGQVTNFYFDDEKWVIRYLVVDTGNWLSSRKVLISPMAIGHPDWTEKVLPVSITKLQVKNSPDIDTEKPVSRQHEIRYLGYYGYPFYWGGVGLWGAGTYPNMSMGGVDGFVSTPHAELSSLEKIHAQAEAARHEDDDPHLRSCKAVIDYNIQAIDGDMGHVQGLLIDEETWAIRYLIVNTSNWWLGHVVLVAPQWIRNVNWFDSTVSVNMTRQEMKDAPPYDTATQLNRLQEVNIFKHYGKQGYWEDRVKRNTVIPKH
jgi:hypothetical protein